MSALFEFTPEIVEAIDEQKAYHQAAYAQRMELEREDADWRDHLRLGIDDLVGGRDQKAYWADVD